MSDRFIVKKWNGRYEQHVRVQFRLMPAGSREMSSFNMRTMEMGRARTVKEPERVFVGHGIYAVKHGRIERVHPVNAEYDAQITEAEQGIAAAALALEKARAALAELLAEAYRNADAVSADEFRKGEKDAA